MPRVDATRRPSSLRLRRPQRLVTMVGVGFLLVYLLSWSGILQTLELATYELRLRHHAPHPPPPSITTVTINDKSFTILKQTIRAWQRTHYARLIDAIASAYPAVTGVEMAWIHASPNPDGDEEWARRIDQKGDDNQPEASILVTQATYAQAWRGGPADPAAPYCLAKGKAEPGRVHAGQGCQPQPEEVVEGTE